MKPGSFDILHFNQLFYSDNYYGIPLLAKQEFMATEFIPFNVITKTNNIGVHCFVYDYYLERIWKKPEVYVKYLEKSTAFLTPDFSLYRDIPIATQIINVYKNRWVGAFLQQYNINVIPTISWSDSDSYEFCFLGVEQNAAVAISTVGILRDDVELFKQGCLEMKAQLNPSKVYVYGSKEKEFLSELFDCYYIETFSKQIRKRVGNGSSKG